MKTVLLFILLITSPLLFAQTTTIPDPNFEQALIDLGHDDVLNGEVLTANIDTLTGINVGGNNISDLTGIADFTSLEYLNCNHNLLTSLDLSQNVFLTRVFCGNNGISNLSLGNLTMLERLYCDFNLLPDINLSGLSALYRLQISNNPLEYIELSANDSLTFLWINNTQLHQLDLQDNENLTSLHCNHNAQLQCLNISNGQYTLSYLSAANNPTLTCIEVDNELWANMDWANNVDSEVVFSEDCDNACSISNAGLDALNSSPKTLTQILDLMGRETTFKPNTPLIYVYDDGSMERVFTIE